MQPADNPATNLLTNAVLSAGDIAVYTSAAALLANSFPTDPRVVCAGIRASARQDAPSILGAGVSGTRGGPLRRRGGS